MEVSGESYVAPGMQPGSGRREPLSPSDCWGSIGMGYSRVERKGERLDIGQTESRERGTDVVILSLPIQRL